MKKINVSLVLVLSIIFMLSQNLLAADALYVDEDGNVGIGTANPNEKLHISVDADASSTLGGAPAVLMLEQDNNNNWSGGEAAAEILFKKGSDIVGAIRSEHTRGSGTEHSYEDAGLTFYVAPAAETPVAFEAMRINEKGYVGIGTTSPNSTFQVEGVFRLSDPDSSNYFQMGMTDSGRLWWVPYDDGKDQWGREFGYDPEYNSWYVENNFYVTSGNVGIGTSPGCALHVVETDSNVAIYGINTQSGTNNYGVYGRAVGDGDINYGIFGYAANANTNYAGYFVGNVYVTAQVSAASFKDRTPFFEGDALSEISKISGKKGEIDHSTLPEFAYSEREIPVFEERELSEISSKEAFEIVQIESEKVVGKEDENGELVKGKVQNGTKKISKGYQAENGKIVEIIEETPTYETELVEKKQLRKDVYLNEKTGKVYKKVGEGEIYEKDGKVFQQNQTGTKIEEQRDIGAMVSILTVAVQQLDEENKTLKNELCTKDKSYSFCKGNLRISRD